MKLYASSVATNAAIDDWKYVAWSDESRLQLYRMDGHVRVSRQPHESMDTAYQQRIDVCPITVTHSCPLRIPADLDNSIRTMRHPKRRELIPSGSRSLLLTLDTSHWSPNPRHEHY
ncbi:hypothetical protein AVEN_270874-1 [Araneus ventricosus]|uniref:Uncharacterized protein n=1 Tax=Araneus ventricosus TaxID=182803 RepID=A0A4Y2LYD1_ARAVE|nr:hypothetical protein AVEN_270874-1 [Araneus ventricosus]